ncbi:MAG: exodeoxyribonuclease VII small subunit [Nitriliruptoraceae bacterium]
MSDEQPDAAMAGPVDDEPTYEAAEAELETIVTALQRDDVGVDELAAKVARGAALVQVCRARLRTAELAVEEVVAALRAAEEPDPPGER